MGCEAKLKVSVALCTYNGADFVEAQLESILNQSRRPDEVVISDDGSNDQTLSIVRRVSERFPGIVRLIENSHRKGYAKNFEFAIGEASGDVIFLSDQDDVWFEHKIERMLAFFAANDRLGLVYCDALLVDRGLRPLGRSIFQASAKIPVVSRHGARDLVRGPDLGIQGAIMAFRSSLKPWVLPIEDVSWGHDHWIAFIAHAVSEVSAVTEPLMYYRRHEHNSAYSRALDGQWWKGLAIGVQTRSIECYDCEIRRWEAMIQRLK